MEQSPSHLGVLLRKAQRLRTLAPQSEATQPSPALRAPTPRGSRFAFSILLAIVPLLGIAVTAASAVEPLPVEEEAMPVPIQLAQSVTTALNAHDVDALVDLFTDEDSGPTLTAERYAWQKSEIRQWAMQQVSANVRVDARNYRLSEYGATWDADVYRDDWTILGVEPLAVTNSIMVHNGRLAGFTAEPQLPSDVEALGSLWRPSASVSASSPLATASAPSPQQPEPADPASVVASFLASRDAGDWLAAAAACAPVLELQDVDGSWFVDRPTTSNWLRQLTDAYAVETLRPLTVSGDTVGWTERLVRRVDDVRATVPSRLTIEVRAVVHNGKIDYLSAPYPPFPLRTSDPAGRSSTDSSAAAPPVMLFLGSAAGLSIFSLFVQKGIPAAYAGLRGRRGDSRRFVGQH
jgi:hypothetical protein